MSPLRATHPSAGQFWLGPRQSAGGGGGGPGGPPTFIEIVTVGAGKDITADPFQPTEAAHAGKLFLFYDSNWVVTMTTANMSGTAGQTPFFYFAPLNGVENIQIQAPVDSLNGSASGAVKLWIGVSNWMQLFYFPDEADFVSVGPFTQIA